jgi:phosphate-selective porin OprO/OprP
LVVTGAMTKQLILIVAVAFLATVPISHGDEESPAESPMTDPQEGMAENLTDTVPDEDESGRLDWLKDGLRVILPENLQDMHRLDVKEPDNGNDNGAPSAHETRSDDTAAPEPPEDTDDQTIPVLLAATDKIMEVSRRPLTYIQERIPFLTKREIIFFGRFEPEAVRYTSGVLKDDSGIQMRRLRLGLAGHIARWPNWNYKFEIDLTDTENTLSDAYLSWYTHKWGTLRIGNQKVAQTLSGRTSSISIPFMERPLPILAFTLERRLGIGYDLHRKRGGLNTTIFAADVNKNVGSQGFAVRGYYNPTRQLSHVVHVGMSFVKFASSNDTQLRARPESNLTDTRLINTGVYRNVDSSSATGFELAGAWGPVTVRSEFYRATWGGKHSGKPEFDGWYAEGSWFLTGEMARYTEGKFIRPRILGDRGAWELALRYSTTDLNDQEVEGGWENNVSMGINWYSKNHWRVMANAIRVKSEGPQGEQDPWIIQTRVQYYF